MLVETDCIHVFFYKVLELCVFLQFYNSEIRSQMKYKCLYCHCAVQHYCQSGQSSGNRNRPGAI